MSWLTNPEEAAEHPRRVLAFVLIAGLVGGGAIGYFRFDRSVLWAVILGVACAGTLAYAERNTRRDPTWIEAGTRGLIRALARLAMPFLVLLVAFIVGLATGSVNAFIVASAVGLALGLALRFTVWR